MFLKSASSDCTVLITIRIECDHQRLPVFVELFVNLIHQSFLLLDTQQLVWHNYRDEFSDEYLCVDREIAWKFLSFKQILEHDIREMVAQVERFFLQHICKLSDIYAFGTRLFDVAKEVIQRVLLRTQSKSQQFGDLDQLTGCLVFLFLFVLFRVLFEQHFLHILLVFLLLKVVAVFVNWIIFLLL